jgi:hypothetical protein
MNVIVNMQGLAHTSFMDVYDLSSYSRALL